MATALLNWNHADHASSLAMGHPVAAAAETPADVASDGSSISSNDFLTLLVTEMKNQDPTANTDPNQYVNQLVQVNSLEQLININQTLTTSLGATPAPGLRTSTSAADRVPITSAIAKPASANGSAAASAGPLSVASGNLAVPAANPAAQRVAQALGRHSHHQ